VLKAASNWFQYLTASSYIATPLLIKRGIRGWRGIIVLHDFKSSDPTILFDTKFFDIAM
jgi:hypothetical protein